MLLVAILALFDSNPDEYIQIKMDTVVLDVALNIFHLRYEECFDNAQNYKTLQKEAMTIIKMAASIFNNYVNNLICTCCHYSFVMIQKLATKNQA